MGRIFGNAGVPRVLFVWVFLYMEEGGAQLGRITQNSKFKTQNI
jgi:hypothetical protein